ncbi:hypothetical protein O6H91_15G069900 [Diphasiastrum complanatum]|uniref:Uncharacterized protein n=1 Tax=Diphasiastrum complanatum TaxID=34168 RepID=A0ACC2BJB3_DIPCM|nr:hypothetical protein O6H91_15G069900 [Diphasiastrum complanatum]
MAAFFSLPELRAELHALGHDDVPDHVIMSFLSQLQITLPNCFLPSSGGLTSSLETDSSGKTGNKQPLLESNTSGNVMQKIPELSEGRDHTNSEQFGGVQPVKVRPSQYSKDESNESGSYEQHCSQKSFLENQDGVSVNSEKGCISGVPLAVYSFPLSSSGADCSKENANKSKRDIQQNCHVRQALQPCDNVVSDFPEKQSFNGSDSGSDTILKDKTQCPKNSRLSLTTGTWLPNFEQTQRPVSCSALQDMKISIEAGHKSAIASFLGDAETSRAANKFKSRIAVINQPSIDAKHNTMKSEPACTDIDCCKEQLDFREPNFSKKISFDIDNCVDDGMTKENHTEHRSKQCSKPDSKVTASEIFEDHRCQDVSARDSLQIALDTCERELLALNLSSWRQNHSTEEVESEGFVSARNSQQKPDKFFNKPISRKIEQSKGSNRPHSPGITTKQPESSLRHDAHPKGRKSIGSCLSRGDNSGLKDSVSEAKSDSPTSSEGSRASYKSKGTVIKRGGKIDRVARFAEMQKLWNKDSFLKAAKGKRKSQSFHRIFANLHASHLRECVVIRTRSVQASLHRPELRPFNVTS